MILIDQKRNVPWLTVSIVISTFICKFTPILSWTHNTLLCFLYLLWCFMRRNKKNIERCRKMGLESQRVQAENRLKSALNYKPLNSYTVFELNTCNPRNGIKHQLIIKHELHNGNNRFNVYLDGEKWGKQWSRYGFCRWLFKQIDSVIRNGI